MPVCHTGACGRAGMSCLRTASPCLAQAVPGIAQLLGLVLIESYSSAKCYIWIHFFFLFLPQNLFRYLDTIYYSPTSNSHQMWKSCHSWSNSKILPIVNFIILSVLGHLTKMFNDMRTIMMVPDVAFEDIRAWVPRNYFC